MDVYVCIWACVCIFISRVESADRLLCACEAFSGSARPHERELYLMVTIVWSCVDLTLDIVDSWSPAKPAPGRRSIIKRAGFAIASIRIEWRVISPTCIWSLITDVGAKISRISNYAIFNKKKEKEIVTVCYFRIRNCHHATILRNMRLKNCKIELF